MNYIVPCVLSILLVFLNQASADKRKLVFVQILFRHGDRSPITLYPNDPNTENFWREGLGKLTMLGRKQHFAFGNYLRTRYQNITDSSPMEIKVISSEVHRCMMSAASNVASFFAPSPQWTFEKNLEWQPITIEYIPKYIDKYLETDSHCPRSDQEKVRILNSPAGQKIMAEHKFMFENLTYYSGKELTNWTMASYFHDTVKIEHKYNLTIPDYIWPFWEELKNVSNLSFYWSYNSPLLHRLRAGPFLQRIIEKIDDKIKGKTPLLKFQLYSSHDTNVAVVLASLNLFNMIAPPYCAAIYFELFEEPGGQHSIRLLYQNSSRPEILVEEPHILVLEGCTEYCPLGYFVNYTANLIPENWEEECQLEKSIVEKIQDKKLAIGWFFIMIAVIIVGMSIFALWKIYSRKKEKYAYHLMNMN